MQYLLSIIAALAAGLFFFRSKAKTAESLNENLDTKKEIVKEDSEIAKNQGRLEAESERRQTIQDSVQREVDKVQSEKDLLDFINSQHKS